MNRKKKSKLKAIYDQVPDAGCKGLCYHECSAIGMSKGELNEIVKETGKKPAIRYEGSCIFLIDKRCSIYNFRPLICRLFGSVDSNNLKCPHGCLAKNPLKDQDSDKLIKAIEKLCGDGNMRFSELPPKIL